MTTAIRRTNGQVIVFDTAENVIRDFPSSVTDHPIETGASITDHIVSDPRQVQVAGVISDAAFRQREDDSFLLGPGRSKQVLDALTAIRDNREIFILETSDELFEDMVLTEFRIPRDSNTGTAARVQFTAQQIDTVQRRFVLVPINIAEDFQDAAADEVSTGKQATPEVDPDQSALIQFFEAVSVVKEQLGEP